MTAKQARTAWRWYQAAWENELVQGAAWRSLLIATVASLFATTLEDRIPEDHPVRLVDEILDRLGYADPYRIPAGAAPPAVRAEDGTP